MKVIAPIQLVTANLISSTVAEPTTTAAGDAVGTTVWSAAVTYAAGARVVRAETHRVYESVAGSNLNNVPESTLSTTPPKWIDLGNTNRWRALRTNANKPAVGASPMVFHVAPGKRVSAVAVSGVIADSVKIEQYDSSSTLVQTIVDNLSSRVTLNWYDYFYGEFGARSAVLQQGLHPISGGSVKLTFTRGAGDVEVGPIVFGTPIDLGSMAKGSNVGVTDFSRIDRDAFGNAILIARKAVPKTTQKTLIPAAQTRLIEETLTAMRATVALFIGIEDPLAAYFESLFVLGIARDWSISMDEPNLAYLSLEIEGL
ncbi:MAG: hypothetical protein EOO22_10005 [Comamonadaceae bacterium]|nr:MAG: hypothetical protein EOO22_10005 [Comamonadaceae bacterium]